MSKRPRVPPRTPDVQRRNGPRQVAELLPDIGRAAFKKFGFVQSSIVSRWSEIVGERWAKVSVPESLRFPIGKKQDGTLTLTVTGAHAVMMQHILPEIVDRVNLFFGYGAVARVVIRHGEIAARPERRAPPSLKAVPLELGASLRTIADPELKAVLESLAAGVAATHGPPRIS